MAKIELDKHNSEMRNPHPLKLISIACAAFLVSGTVASAQVSSQAGATILDFLTRNISPASLGRGGTDLAFSDSPSSSAFANPASVSLSPKRFDAEVAGSSWQPDRIKTTVFNAAMSYCHNERFGASAAVSYGAGDSYEMPGASTTTFTPKEIVGGVSVSYRPLDFLSAGVSVKYASSKLAPENDYASFAADAFVLADVSGIRFTAGVRNIGGKVKASDGTSFNLPSSVSAGVWYQWKFGESNKVETGADTDIFLKGGFSASAGAEYSFKDRLFARLGYSHASDKAPMATFSSVGLGFSLSMVRIDAAYILPLEDSPLKNTFTLGAKVAF